MRVGLFFGTFNPLHNAHIAICNKLLEKNTFTITTGHQLNLLTGPLYFIYKIISVINLCENMQKNNPENNFVPVFWMASEDHDFAEINHFSFKDEKFLWPSKDNGVVGEFKLESIQGTIDRFEKHIKGFNYTAEIIEIIRECYLNSVDLSNATRKLVNILFSKFRRSSSLKAFANESIGTLWGTF